MASAALSLPSSPRTLAESRALKGGENRTRVYGVTWEDFKRLQELFLQNGGGRVALLDNVIEIMTISLEHEERKSLLGRLLELYLDFLGIDWFHHGSRTLEKRQREAAKEPDESYAFHEQNAERPDLAIEVAITRSGLNTLEIYRRYGVPEVWIWHRQQPQIHLLEEGGYSRSKTSRWFPQLSVTKLVECARLANAAEARRKWRAFLAD